MGQNRPAANRIGVTAGIAASDTPRDREVAADLHSGRNECSHDIRRRAPRTPVKTITGWAMFDLQTFFLFLAAALLVAVTPGPGIFYIVARTLASGGSEGLASSVGLGIGGLVHVFGGAVGLSALVMASAEAFTLLKIVGGLYLIWLGIKTWREARIVELIEVQTTGAYSAFREDIVVEALNPKTAAFFLAFIPRFVDPSASIGAQFIVLGLISVALNSRVKIRS